MLTSLSQNGLGYHYWISLTCMINLLNSSIIIIHLCPSHHLMPLSPRLEISPCLLLTILFQFPLISLLLPILNVLLINLPLLQLLDLIRSLNLTTSITSLI